MKKSILIVPLLLIFISSCSYNQTFNNVPSMEAKIAKELDVKQVSIFDSEDVGDYRFVGYTSNNQQGYAAFKLNENGDYVFDILKKTDKMISRARDIYNDSHISYWIVLNNNKDLNTIQWKIKYNSGTGDEIKTIEVTDCPGISILKLPEGDYTGEYNFYDNKGNLIK